MASGSEFIAWLELIEHNDKCYKESMLDAAADVLFGKVEEAKYDWVEYGVKLNVEFTPKQIETLQKEKKEYHESLQRAMSETLFEKAEHQLKDDATNALENSVKNGWLSSLGF